MSAYIGFSKYNSCCEPTVTIVYDTTSYLDCSYISTSFNFDFSMPDKHDLFNKLSFIYRIGFLVSPVEKIIKVINPVKVYIFKTVKHLIKQLFSNKTFNSSKFYFL